MTKTDDKKAEKETKVSPKLSKLIEEVEKLSVLELSELVKALEKKFGVSAAAPMAVGPAPAASGQTPGQAVADEAPAEVTLTLTDGGANKIAVIKAVREIKPDLGLKEAKDLVEAAPKPLLEKVKKEEAEEAKKKLLAAGAQVEIK